MAKLQTLYPTYYFTLKPNKKVNTVIFLELRYLIKVTYRVNYNVAI